MESARHLKTATIAAVASEAQCDLRTVRAVFEGGLLVSAPRMRAHGALVRRGLLACGAGCQHVPAGKPVRGLEKALCRQVAASIHSDFRTVRDVLRGLPTKRHSETRERVRAELQRLGLLPVSSAAVPAGVA